MTYEAWKYYKSHVITSATTLTNYQTKLTVYYGSGTDSSSSVYCNSHCNTDFSDIRFANASGTALPYWIESKTDGVSAVVWVKVDSISTSTTIYFYYGNSVATSESSGDSTFLLFDDFLGTTLDASKWTTSTGTVTVSGGSVTCTNTAYSTAQGIKSTSTFGLNTGIYAKIKSTGYSTSNYPEAGYSDWGSFQIGMTYNGNVNYIALTDYNGSNQQKISLISNDTNYHTIDIKRISNSLVYGNIDGGSYSSLTTYLPTGSAPVSFRPYSTSGYVTIIVDYVAVRQVAATEPTHSNWGSETLTTREHCFCIIL